MKDKTKKIIFSIISGLAIIGTSLGFGLGFGLPKKDLDGVSNTGDSSRTYVKELWNSTTQKFHKASLNELYRMILGDSTADIFDIQKSSTLSSVDIRNNNKGYDVTVTLGGLEWQVMYLSKDNDGNSIATLWLSNSCQEDFVGRSQTEGYYHGFVKLTDEYTGLYSDWSADIANPYFEGNGVKLPTNQYATSYIRAVTLNNGGYYAEDTLNERIYSPSSNSVFAKFTMSDYGLTDYIVTPSNVSWQDGQESVNFGLTDYTEFNESTTKLGDDANWFNSVSYGDGASVQESIYYTAWIHDYLWLPSYLEVGNGVITGLWGARNQQRQNYNGVNGYNTVSGTIGSVNSNSNPNHAYHYSWLRSGYYANASHVADLGSNGSDVGHWQADFTMAVRPALHLNLTHADQNINDYELAKVPSNMNQWTRYHSSVQISYNRDSDTNTITVTGEEGWKEFIYYPLSVSANTYYKIMFQYSMPAFSPLSDYSIYLGGVPFGVHSTIPTSAVDAYGNLGYDILYPSTTGQGEVYFNSGSNTTVYVLINFCYVTDGSTNTFIFSHINNMWQYNYDIDWEGSGTKEAPYQISSEKELAGLAVNVNNANVFSEIYFVQTSNIDLRGFSWTPIGNFTNTSTYMFAGHYDGNNYKISNLNIGYNVLNPALFGAVKGSIKNTILKNCYINSNNDWAGSLASIIETGTLIENCHSEGSVQGSIYIGGLVGYNWRGIIRNSSFNGNVLAAGETGGAGGIAGYSYGNNALIENCSVSGNIEAVYYNAGGIVGATYESDVRRCVFNGNVEGLSSVGSIIGKTDAGIISDCSGYGNIFTNGTTDNVAVSGIVGSVYISIDISNCSFVGGSNILIVSPFLAPQNSATCSISGCYSIMNEDKYYSIGDFSGWTIMNNMNDGLPMQNNLYAIAIGGYTSEEVIANLKSKGFSLYS